MGILLKVVAVVAGVTNSEQTNLLHMLVADLHHLEAVRLCGR